MDGDEHAFYAQFNKIDNLKNVIVAYKNDIPVGCGAFKPFDDNTVEIKRMFVDPKFRGQRIATAILDGLEKWAKKLGYSKCVLETGKRQVEAMSFYQKCNYQITPNFGQYKGVDNSCCFEKILT